MWIAHHGILGMHWGKRNGPPYPLGFGDHSASEKKAGWKKSLKKTQKSNYKTLKKNKNSIGNNDITEMVSKNVSAERAASLKNAAKNFSKAFDKYDRQADKVFNSARKTAYKETYDWFAKNEPEYLKTIIKNNGGRKDNLDDFHDFRKVFEGTHDEHMLKLEKSNSYDKNLKSNYEKAYDDYVKEQKAVVDNFLGKYGNKRISMFSKEKYKDMVLKRVNWSEIMNKKISPKVDKNQSMINEAKANKQIIAKQVAKELTNDLIRWNKNGSDTYMKGKDVNAVQKQIEKQIAKNINDASNPFEFKDTFNFGISGIKNYSDYAPLTIEYNPKTKKVTRIDYT